MNYKKLPFISKVTENSEAFGVKVIDIADRLDIAPEWLMVVMNNESGINSHIKNPYSSATGLIQFIEPTAKSLGTTTAELSAMTNVQQLEYVYKYLEPYASKMKDAADVYLAVFYPEALFHNDSYIFPSWVVKANPIFDLNKDGTLTKKEFKEYVTKKYGQYTGGIYLKKKLK